MTDDRRNSSPMISRSRSGPTAAAMSIEPTTSANSTVTCLYSAWLSATTADPQESQNRAPSLSSAPHDPHDTATVQSCPTREKSGLLNASIRDLECYFASCTSNARIAASSVG